jgi:hypothetical protein
MYIEFTVNGNTDWFIRCHQHAFEYLGVCHRRSCTTISKVLSFPATEQGASSGMNAIWIMPRTAALHRIHAARIVLRTDETITTSQ